jgi:hypothetical protein
MRGRHQVRAVVICVALIALVLRTLVPVGWMSVAAGESPAALMPCPMMDGMRGMPMPPQPPTKQQGLPSHEGSICPFATPPQPVRPVEPSRIEVAAARFVFFAVPTSYFTPDWDHVPRAPPATA